MPSRRWLWLAAPLVVVLVAMGWWRGVVGARAARQELAELAARRARLAAANQALSRDVAALKSDREARVRAARAALDAAAPGEVLVIVPPPTPTAIPHT